MNEKRAKKLRKLSGYIKPEKVEIKGIAHGVKQREIGKPAWHLNQETNKMQLMQKVIKYQAVTHINNSKLKYNIAKKTFKRLKKQGLK